jgi:outer membrane protein assembly factor BamE (lipoprotein component of BamABCDE complex)
MVGKFDRARLLAVAAFPVVLAACSPTIATRGNLLDEDRIAAIQPGATKNDVIAAWGSPTMIGTFDDSTWYYMGQRTKKTAFFDPQVTERKVIAVHFDSADRVAAVDQRDHKDGQRIDVVDRETPTAGKDMTVMQQLMGNLGRFSGKPGGSLPSSSPRRRSGTGTGF